MFIKMHSEEVKVIFLSSALIGCCVVDRCLWCPGPVDLDMSCFRCLRNETRRWQLSVICWMCK